MFLKRIPLAGPWVTEKEVSYAADAAQNAWYDNHNLYNGPFEKKFADFIGVKHAISVPHCTSAIHLSLLAMGIGPGDEVIAPDATWIASVAPVSYVGATLKLADVDKKSWCLDPDSFESLITKRTKVVIPVGLYGSMPEFQRIKAIAERHNIKILEDAAEAFGSKYNGQYAGTFGDTAVFSFHASKTLSTGEGGMVVTNDDMLFERMMFLRDHGRAPGNVNYQNTEVAYKYKMSPVQAALGLAQIERADELIAKKIQIFSWYKERLQQFSFLSLNPDVGRVDSSYWLTTVVYSPELRIDKYQLIKNMALRNVDCRPFFNPLSSLDAFRDLPDTSRASHFNVVSYELGGHGINLPSAPIITREQVEIVCRVLIDEIDKLRSNK